MDIRNRELGTVVEALPNATFKLALEDGREILAFLAGKMKLNKIRVIVGDRVLVELDPYGGKNTNRIVRREKN